MPTSLKISSWVISGSLDFFFLRLSWKRLGIIFKASFFQTLYASIVPGVRTLIGGLLGGVTGCIAGAVTGGIIGENIGNKIDEHLASEYTCNKCGKSFAIKKGAIENERIYEEIGESNKRGCVIY